MIVGVKTIVPGIPGAVRTVYVFTWTIIVLGIVAYGVVGATHH
jgi:hypothetical protein